MYLMSNWNYLKSCLENKNNGIFLLLSKMGKRFFSKQRTKKNYIKGAV